MRPAVALATYLLILLGLGMPARAAKSPTETTCGQFNAAKRLDALHQPSNLPLYSEQLYSEWHQLDQQAVSLGHAPVITSAETMQAGVEALLSLCANDTAESLADAGKIAWGAVALAIAHLQDEENGDVPPDLGSP